MGFIDAKRNALVWLGCYRVLYRGDVCHYFGGQTGMTTTDIAGLCERLRARKPTTSGGELANPDGPEAADTLERQAAEIERLRGALGEITKMTKALRIATSALILAGQGDAAKMVTAIADDFENHARAALTGEDA